jgi:hypothetical protein
MSKNTPAPPDYAGAANAQAQSSREVTEQQTWANRPTINTPFGQQTWAVQPTWDPSTGQYINSWTQNTNLTPESQAALDSQMRLQQGRSDMAEGLLNRSRDEYGQPMDWSQFQQLQTSLDAPEYQSENIQRSIGNTPDYVKSAEDAIYGQWSARQEPRMQQQSEALRTRLYNMGVQEGDARYDQEMQRLTQDQGDARQQAQYQATIGSGAEAQRMQGMDAQSGNFANSAAQQALQQQLALGNQRFGQQQTAAGFQNTARQQQITEEMTRRGFSLNEINAILTGQQVGMPSMPGFNAANRSEGTQALQAAGMQSQDAWNAYNAQQQATQGTLSGLAGGAMMFSDRRLKKNVEVIGQRKDGLYAYKFNYIWEDPLHTRQHVGLMAQEVEKLYPEAVIRVHDYLMVDYGKLPELE